MAEWSAARFIEMLRAVSPSLVTDPARRSWLDHPSLGPAMREAAAREGSALDGMRTDHLRWVADGPRILVEIGPAEETRRNLPRALRSRTRLGRPITIYGEEQRSTLQLGASPGCAASGP